MNPWLKMSATTPNVTAATVVALRPFWRCTLRQASISLAERGKRVARLGLVRVSEGINNTHACGLPRRVKPSEEGRHNGKPDSVRD